MALGPNSLYPLLTVEVCELKITSDNAKKPPVNRSQTSNLKRVLRLTSLCISSRTTTIAVMAFSGFAMASVPREGDAYAGAGGLLRPPTMRLRRIEV